MPIVKVLEKSKRKPENRPNTNVTVVKEKNYPLHKAIRCRNITKIKKLLVYVENINEKNELGCPPLVYACQQENNDEMLNVLFEQNKIDPFETGGFEKEIALHILAFKGQLVWIKKFFEKFPQVPVDVATSKGDTALILAAKMDHVDVIDFLYKKGAKINHTNTKQFTALHYAANNGYILSTKRLLELGADVNALDDRGCTPLIKACSWGFEETCKILLKNGAKVNPISRMSALTGAIRNGNLDIAKLLLNSGADPNYVFEYQQDSFTALGAACATKNIEAIKFLLDFGADVNVPGSYSIALFSCIKQDFPKGVKELIRAGVRIGSRHPKYKCNALEIATKWRKYEIVKLLQTIQMSRD